MARAAVNLIRTDDTGRSRLSPQLRAVLPKGGTLPDAVWRRRHRGVLFLLWLHLPALFVFALARGKGLAHALLEVGVVAVPAIAAQCNGRRREGTIFASIGLMTASAVLVHLSGGMIEAHFHFFVMVGVVVLYQDWSPFLVAIGYVVLHHGVVGVLSPRDVYNHPAAWDDPWTWAAIHGAAILGISIAGMATWRLNESLQHATLDREAKLAEAHRLARLGGWEWELDTGAVRWSEELYRLLGRPLDWTPSLAGFMSLVDPQDREAVEAAVAHARETGESFAVDFRTAAQDGSVRWFSARGDVDRNDKGELLRRMHGTCQEITDAKETEEARLGSELRYRGIVESTQEGVWTFDRAYATTFVNARMADMLGYPVEEILGQSVFVFVSEWGREILTRPASEPVAGEQARYDCKLRRNDGSELWVDMGISWAAEPTGEAGLVGLAMVSDITARKRVEQALAVARDEAVEASRLKSQFLANTSHEIRTPMTVILGMNELLLDTDLDQTQRKFAEGVSRAGASLLAIINDILDFSKIEAGHLDLEFADVELPPLIDELEGLLAQSAQAKGLRLACSCQPDVPDRVRADAVRLRQVLLNLASNAVKFTDEGEVEVRVSRAQRAAGHVVRFEVVDTGIGISTDDQRRLFQPFSQVDASNTRRHGGTGLGLAISAQLVEAMGGRIGVKSTPGVGSMFWFEIAFEELPALASPRS